MTTPKTTAPFAFRVVEADDKEPFRLTEAATWDALVAGVVDGWIAWAFGRLDHPDIPSLPKVGGELLLDGMIVVQDMDDFDASDSIHDPEGYARFEREVIAALNARGLPNPFDDEADIGGEFEDRIRAIARKALLPGD